MKGEKPNLFLIYPQGNPLSATEDSPYLQIGEVKYGRPILDRGIEFGSTSLDVAGTYALLSLDAAMRSNVTVGPPLEVLLYQNDRLDFDRYRRFADDDPELDRMHARWEQALRRAVEDPTTQWGRPSAKGSADHAPRSGPSHWSAAMPKVSAPARKPSSNPVNHRPDRRPGCCTTRGTRTTHTYGSVRWWPPGSGGTPPGPYIAEAGTFPAPSGP